MTRWHEYGKTHREPVPCATCGLPSSHWFPDGSPAWDRHAHTTARAPYYQDDAVTLYLGDSTGMDLPTEGTLVMDPPFQLWGSLAARQATTVIAFTTWLHREHVERLYGKPRTELVWAFDVGRWVSHRLPLATHEAILVYGETGSSYVGDETDGIPLRKGGGSVGMDTYPTRTYVPRDRKAITSVLSYPRDTRGSFGIWTKPLPMVQRLIAWAGNALVVDPFCGSGTSLVAAKSLGFKAVGVEIEERACEIAANRLRQEVLGLVG